MVTSAHGAGGGGGGEEGGRAASSMIFSGSSCCLPDKVSDCPRIVRLLSFRSMSPPSLGTFPEALGSRGRSYRSGPPPV